MVEEVTFRDPHPSILQNLSGAHESAESNDVSESNHNVDNPDMTWTKRIPHEGDNIPPPETIVPSESALPDTASSQAPESPVHESTFTETMSYFVFKFKIKWRNASPFCVAQISLFWTVLRSAWQLSL